MLPSAVKAYLDNRLEGVSRNELAVRAQRISQQYRRGHGSSAAIRDDLDVLAYAIARMPATYAAVSHALSRCAPHIVDFAPASLLDLGAGTGSATLAALDVWPSFTTIRQVEKSALFRGFAAELLHALHRDGEVVYGDLARAHASDCKVDLVIAGYVLVELEDRDVAHVATEALERSNGLVVFVEPGTPDGFTRIHLAREALIDAGGKIIAPCPGNVRCPMADSDWCHFSARLARSRDHMLLKDAEVPYEDERYAYVAATRTLSTNPATRVLREPEETRGNVILKLCTSAGLSEQRFSRRDKALHKAARKTKWGDAYKP